MQLKELEEGIDNASRQTRAAIGSRLLTPTECAAKLGVSPSTFLWWTNQYDDFPTAVKGDGGKRGHRPLYWWNDIDVWYAAREAKKG